MLLDLEILVKKFGLKIKRILHIGAHECEELPIYRRIGVKDDNIIWIDGNKDLVGKMQKLVKNVYHGLISDTVGDVNFIITNNGQSSSILELDEHKKEHPDIHEIERRKLQTTTVPKFFEDQKLVPNFNFVNIDVQGAELRVLKGMADMLETVDYIYAEVNTRSLYKDCGLIDEIDSYLSQYGFIRVETKLTSHGWGDALYIKHSNKPISLSTVVLSAIDNKETLALWPLVHKMWTQVVKINCKLILVADKLSLDMKHLDDVILFKPIQGVPSNIQADYIRFLYPALMESQGAILSSNIDILPLSSECFSECNINGKISRYENAKYLSGEAKVWQKVFNVNSIDDVKAKLLALTESKITVVDKVEALLKEHVKIVNTLEEWSDYKHLDKSHRNILCLNQDDYDDICKGKYCDYTILTPYSVFNEQTDKIVEAVSEALSKERTTITRAKDLRWQQKYADAIKVLDTLRRQKGNPATVDDYEIWDEYTVCCYYVDRSKGIDAFNSLIKRKSNPVTLELVKKNADHLLDVVGYYNDQALIKEIKDMIAYARKDKAVEKVVMESEAAIKNILDDTKEVNLPSMSLCIPTVDRYDKFLSVYLPKYIENKYIDEIVISDENGNDACKIKERFGDNKKIKVYVNKERLGAFLNKVNVISKARNNWVALIDSDNFVDLDYFQVLNDFFTDNTVSYKTILSPSWAKPNFSFKHMEGMILSRSTIAQLREHDKQYSMLPVLINAGNYVINKRLVEKLDISRDLDEIKNCYLDVLLMNMLLMERLDANLIVVKDMHYSHVVHDGSFYLTSSGKVHDFQDRSDKLLRRFYALNKE